MLSSRQVMVTADDRGPLIKIAAWIMMVAFICTAIVKVVTKILMVKRLQVDDFLIVTATLLAIGQVVATTSQVDAGLGRHQSAEAQDGSFGKAELAADIFYVAVLCLGRNAVCCFQYILSGGNVVRRRTVQIFAAVDVAWAVTSIFVLGFQCSLPRTWLSTATCTNRAAFWTVFGVLNIIFDVVLAFLPYYILQDLQLTADKKAPIMRVFQARVLALPLIILRIVFTDAAYSSADFAYDDYNASIVTEIHVGISLILSCIPFLKPILDNLQSGILVGDLRTTAAFATAAGGKSYAKKPTDYVLASIRSVEPSGGTPATPKPWETKRNTITISTSGLKDGKEDGSMSSREPIVIQQTTTIQFEEEGAPHAL